MNRSITTLAILFLFAFQPLSDAAGAAKPPIKASKGYTVMSGKTVLGTIRNDMTTPIEALSESTSRDESTGVITLTGNARVSLKSTGEASAIFTGAKLRLVPIK